MSHRPYYSPPRPRPKSSGTGKRVLWVLIVGAAAAVAVSMFSDRAERRGVSPPPPPEPMARMRANRLQSHAADNGIVGGAAAAQRELAARPSDGEQTQHVSTKQVRREPGQHVLAGKPSTDSPDRQAPAIRLTGIRSNTPHSSHERAVDDALEVARQKLIEQLRAQDPPIEREPSLEDVRAKYFKPGSDRVVKPSEDIKAEWAKANLDPDRMWVTVDVEVTPEQVRELRAGDRLTHTGWLAAAGLMVIAALYGFLRVDAWTKGYLTGGLAVAAAAAAGGGVALLFLMR